MAEFAGDGRILKFVEKPKPGESTSHWVNVGIDLMKREIIDHIPGGFSDFGKDIFPDLLAKGVKIYGVCDDKDVKVFDNPEMYKKSFEKY